MKKCNRCGELKELSLFHKNKKNKDGLNNRCAKCTVEYNNERYAKSSNLRDYQKKYAIDNGIHTKRKLKKYGITKDQYEDMVNYHNGFCGICNEKPEQLYIDHDHKTGKVRGLLCLKCNTSLGLLKDSIEILESAIKYLNIANN